MLSNFFTATTIARHIISVTLLTSAATAMVAGSVDPVGTVIQRADQVTSVTRDEHGENDELHGLVKDCIESREKTSEACQKAIEASGLTADEFYARIAASFEARKKEPKRDTSNKPETPSANANVEGLIRECIARYSNAAKTPEGSSAAKEVCMRAIEASGLTPEEFFKRFLQRDERKPEPKPESRPGELVKTCVTMAAQLSGDSSREDVEKTAAVCAKAKDAFDH